MYYEMHTFYGDVPDITMTQKISCREGDDPSKIHNLTEEEAKWIFNHFHLPLLVYLMYVFGLLFHHQLEPFYYVIPDPY